ncbi:uncharacterized protein LOC131619153 [Vicia villosa]|uniref:uncharacterized protein LOC131619153 n=1 Tax=Vicia villosa TaxID=3911 RepID=UPI00273C4AA9|nr:uncharacterized protein LOC131619153 [Vicia villosa]
MDFKDLFPEAAAPVSSPSIPEASKVPSVDLAPPARSFTQALKGVCDIPFSQFPPPVIKGDRPSITIPEDEYKAGLNDCKNNLHGRVLWPKGSSPLTVAAIRVKLASLWSDVKHWGILSLGKGFYELTFSCAEDMRRVRASGAINLNPGMLKLFAWSKDFNPSLQHNTAAQVWVRFFGLAQEYWRPRILFAIASCVGTPICIDSASYKSRLDRTFGHFVRVLVEMDLTQPLHHNVLVEREGFAFFSDIEYENIPALCSHCKKTGHEVQDCKFLRKSNSNQISKAKVSVVPKTSGNLIIDPEIPVPGDASIAAKSKEGISDNTVVADGVEDPQIRILDPVINNSSLEIVVADPVHQNSSNFVSQVPVDSESQVSSFVDATQKRLGLDKEVDADFLQDSWGNLENQEKGEGAFSAAISNLNKSQGTKKSKNIPQGPKQA